MVLTNSLSRFDDRLLLGTIYTKGAIMLEIGGGN